MTEDELMIAVIRAASAGFSEGLVYACARVVSGVRVDSIDRVAGESVASSCVPIVEKASEIDQEVEQNYSDQSEQSEAFESSDRPVTPYELAQAMSAMTQPVPDGMFDPMEPTESRPSWLQ